MNRVVLVIAVFVMFFTSCQKQDIPDNYTYIEFPGEFREEFEVNKISCHKTLNEVVIKLSNEKSVDIIIALSDFKIGTYHVKSQYIYDDVNSGNDEQVQRATFICKINGRNYFAESGDVNITKLTDGKISGTYEIFGYSNDNVKIPFYIKNGQIQNIKVNHIKYGSVIDFEGNEYKSVDIGDQTWMAENLGSKLYIDGSVIDNVYSYSEWDEEYSDKKYGRLYTWSAANQGKSINKDICPEGWHLPSVEEWQKLIEALGGEYKAISRITTPVGWGIDYSDDRINSLAFSTNSSGFSLMPAGYLRGSDHYYYGFKITSRIWTSTVTVNENNDTLYSYIVSRHDNLKVGENSTNARNDGYSVRCIKD